MKCFWDSFVDSLVFQPLSCSSYDFVPADSHDGGCELRLKLLDTGRTVRNSDAGWWMTSRGNSIAFVYVRSAIRRPVDAAIILSHGNSGDIGTVYKYAVMLATELCCDVLCYDYSGYGLSSDRPSKPNFYADAEAAVDVLRVRYGFRNREVVLYGISLGTVACVKLASVWQPPDRTFAGVVLQAPLASVGRCVWSGFRWLPCIDRFNSARRIGSVRCPVLIAHDKLDDVVPFRDALSLCRRCPTAWCPVITVGMGHIVPFDCIGPDVRRFFDRVTDPTLHLE